MSWLLARLLDQSNSTTTSLMLKHNIDNKQSSHLSQTINKRAKLLCQRTLRSMECITLSHRCGSQHLSSHMHTHNMLDTE
jgi:hypothetical protein